MNSSIGRWMLPRTDPNNFHFWPGHSENQNDLRLFKTQVSEGGVDDMSNSCRINNEHNPVHRLSKRCTKKVEATAPVSALVTLCHTWVLWAANTYAWKNQRLWLCKDFSVFGARTCRTLPKQRWRQLSEDGSWLHSKAVIWTSVGVWNTSPGEVIGTRLEEGSTEMSLKRNHRTKKRGKELV